MIYTITTSYYGEPSISDEYATFDEALEAMQDTLWAARSAPSDVAGDIRSVTLRHGERVVRSVAFPPGY